MFKYSAQNTSSSSLSLLLQRQKDQKRREHLEKDGRESQHECLQADPKSTKCQEVGLEKQAAQADPSSSYSPSLQAEAITHGDGRPPSSSGNPAQGQCSEEEERASFLPFMVSACPLLPLL